MVLILLLVSCLVVVCVGLVMFSGTRTNSSSFAL